MSRTRKIKQSIGIRISGSPSLKIPYIVIDLTLNWASSLTLEGILSTFQKNSEQSIGIWVFVSFILKIKWDFSIISLYEIWNLNLTRLNELNWSNLINQINYLNTGFWVVEFEKFNKICNEFRMLAPDAIVFFSKMLK